MPEVKQECSIHSRITGFFFNLIIVVTIFSLQEMYEQRLQQKECLKFNTWISRRAYLLIKPRLLQGKVMNLGNYDNTSPCFMDTSTA